MMKRAGIRITGILLSMSIFLLNGCETEGTTSQSTPDGSAAGSTVGADQETQTTTGTTAVPVTHVAVGDKVEFHGRQWEVTFSDDFEGTRLNSQNWTYCPAWKRQDKENYWNRGQVTFPGNDCLSLGIEKEEDGNRILSGAIWTSNIFEQAYGYFEVRCRLQPAAGCWSAFWLMCDSQPSVGNGGVDGAEIDIVESPFFNRSTIQHNIHWDGYAEDHGAASSGDVIRPGLYTDFHTYALEWTKEEYIFYVDGEETWRTSAGGVCTVPCYLILSVEAGSWGGELIDEQLPAAFLVDYVRVYKECE